MRYVLVAFLVIATIGAGIGGGIYVVRNFFGKVVEEANAAAAPKKPDLVGVAPVVQSQIEPRQIFVGTVMPLRRAVIGSAVDGRVVEVPVDVGTRVAAGQKLAQLLTETISLELEAAEHELELRREELRLLKEYTLPDEITEAEATLATASALAEHVAGRFGLLKSLYEERSAVLPQELSEAESNKEGAVARAMAARRRLELLKQNQETRIAQAESKVRVQHALVERLRDMRKKHTVISRFNGYVVAKHSEIGQWANRGDVMAEVVAIDEVEVEAGVLEDHAEALRIGTPITVTVPSIGKSFQGYVSKVNPQADPRTRTVPVKVRVVTTPLGEYQLMGAQMLGGGPPQVWHHAYCQEHGPVLKAGMLAQMELPIDFPQQALLVPKDALVLGANRKQLWVVKERQPGDEGFTQGNAQLLTVETGAAKGGWIQVKGDLRPGDLVVTKGNERIFAPPGTPALVRWQGEEPLPAGLAQQQNVPPTVGIPR